MSEHDWCQDGVPCWVDTLQPDPDSAVAFYAELFGWEVENRTASDSHQKYFVCMLRGRDVAGVGAQPSEGMPPDWNTYVRVDSVEEAAARAGEAGAVWPSSRSIGSRACRRRFSKTMPGPRSASWSGACTRARRSSTNWGRGRCQCSTPATWRAPSASTVRCSAGTR